MQHLFPHSQNTKTTSWRAHLQKELNNNALHARALENTNNPVFFVQMSQRVELAHSRENYGMQMNQFFLFVLDRSSEHYATRQS
jgi:hypothetical protein